jgi:hypothetical protein
MTARLRGQMFAREKERILREIEERGAELAKLLHEFQVGTRLSPPGFSTLTVANTLLSLERLQSSGRWNDGV